MAESARTARGEVALFEFDVIRGVLVVERRTLRDGVVRRTVVGLDGDTDRLGANERRAVPRAELCGGFDIDTGALLRDTDEIDGLDDRRLGTGLRVTLRRVGLLLRLMFDLNLGVERRTVLRFTVDRGADERLRLTDRARELRGAVRVLDLAGARCTRELLRRFVTGSDEAADALLGATVAASAAVRNIQKPIFAHARAFMIDLLFSSPYVFSV